MTHAICLYHNIVLTAELILEPSIVHDASEVHMYLQHRPARATRLLKLSVCRNLLVKSMFCQMGRKLV